MIKKHDISIIFARQLINDATYIKFNIQTFNITYHILLITYHILLITNHILLITYHILLIIYHILLITYYVIYIVSILSTGDSPGWYLSRIYVEDLQTNKRSLFICERWFAVEFEDGLIDRTVPVASYQDQKVFTHLFTTKAAQDLSDQHLWLSVALKRAHDTFTRVQRLTCCMSLLFTTMLASAMFFQLGNNSKYLWKIGSLVIDYKGIIIGIQSGFVVIPVNFVIAWFFRHSESFAVYRRRREKRKITGETVERKMMLPCGFVIIAWFLAIASIVASLVIVLFYSMQWGNDKSQQFVLSVFTSFVQSAFLIQPVKLVLVAMVLALILKRGTDETDILDTYKYCGEEREANNEKVEIDMSKLQTRYASECFCGYVE